MPKGRTFFSTTPERRRFVIASSTVRARRNRIRTSRRSASKPAAGTTPAADLQGFADPAVDVHAEWTGTGPQRLLTILALSPDATNPVSTIERASGGGVTRVRLTLRGGTSVFVQSSDSGQPQKLHASGIKTEALTLIVCQCEGQPLSGVVLGAKTWADTPAATPDFEFTEQPDRAVKPVAIRAPGRIPLARRRQGWNRARLCAGSIQARRITMTKIKRLTAKKQCA